MSLKNNVRIHLNKITELCLSVIFYNFLVISHLTSYNLPIMYIAQRGVRMLRIFCSVLAIEPFVNKRRINIRIKDISVGFLFK